MTYKEAFIRFMAESGVLKFGDFTLKSGRKSPYFINAGNYNKGDELTKLGEFYADCLIDNQVEFDTVFGPAYKGIPLSVATAIALSQKHNKNVYYSFDRKEEKDHGEGGWFVGKQPEKGDKIVIIDDVSTSGKALREVLPKLQNAANVEIAAFVITADRMEKALNSEKSAVQQIREEFGIPVYSIVNMNDIISAIENEIIPGKEYLPAMLEYRKEYGVAY
jgi:orotate phosphoribosyltransferase